MMRTWLLWILEASSLVIVCLGGIVNVNNLICFRNLRFESFDGIRDYELKMGRFLEKKVSTWGESVALYRLALFVEGGSWLRFDRPSDSPFSHCNVCTPVTRLI